jgi:DNA-directed RNA polymerase subunit H (RpoH/RPB5)
MQPKHTVLTSDEAESFKKKYNIMDNSQIPDISYFSPVSILMGIRPNDIVKIERKSRTAITSMFYRICKFWRDQRTKKTKKQKNKKQKNNIILCGKNNII